MDGLIEIIKDCLSYDDELEWVEYKENKFVANEVGEYISALSNSAAILGKPFAYIIWGINNRNHDIVGTTINYNGEVNNEPLQHFLARKLSPSISFYFKETTIDNKRIVILTIPSAKVVPTDFDGVRYIRIGSSKENLKKYPQRESFLFSVLSYGLPTINSKESQYQDLTFNQLFTYFASRDIILNKNNFKTNLHLLTNSGKYNIMAQLLSDNSHVPIRVAIFLGRTKASKMYSVKEFGYKCLLYSLYEVLNYGEILNVPQAEEEGRIMERREIPLFDNDVYREAVVNAFLHNKWVDLNEPMFTVYSDRIEILSRGELAPLQTKSGFYRGHSIPVNEKLSELFLQLHISEKTGRGVPIITDVYGEKAIEISNGNIIITIPFKKYNSVGDKVGNKLEKVGNKVGNKLEKVGDKVGDKQLNRSQLIVLIEIRNNPNITKSELMNKCELGRTSIDKIISFLRKNKK